MKKISVQFVCLGNICRSPLAHAVFQKKVEEAGLSKQILIESSGIGNWHIGMLPDRRMREVAKLAGYQMDHRARQFSYQDLAQYDYLLAMDHQNYSDICSFARTKGQIEKVHLFREWDPIPGDRVTPDPYYGGNDQFQLVLSIVERTCDSLLEDIRKKL